MVNYQNAKIYKLVNNSSDMCYYGSTCNPLYKRKGQHKAHFKRWKNGEKKFITSFLLFDDEEPDIILVENFPCENKEQLRARERHWIVNNKCVNKYIPSRRQGEYKEYMKEYLKEYHKANKDKIKEYMKEYLKEYHEANKDKIKECQKKYREVNKDKIKEYQKEYREVNKDKIKEYKKKYREVNKDKIKEYQKK